MDFKSIPEIKDLYIMRKEELPDYAECLSESFDKYPLFVYFCGGKYNDVAMEEFWETNIRAGKGQILCLGSDSEPKAAVLFCAPNYKDAGFFRYIKSGGFDLIREFGIKNVIRMLRFDSFSQKIKKHWSNESCWYIYSFGVKPKYQGSGYASKLLKPMLAYFDRTKQDCYLETMKENNVSLYEHYGFELVETTTIPKTDITMYAMLRKPK